MAASEIGRDPRIADESADVVIEGREVLARGFRPYERVRARQAGGEVETRDVLRAGAAVAVLPIDLAREEVVLIRSFACRRSSPTAKAISLRSSPAMSRPTKRIATPRGANASRRSASRRRRAS